MLIDGQAPQDAQSILHMTQNGHIVPPAATSVVPRGLPEICYTLRRKVIAFLDQQSTEDDAVLRGTQKQTKASIEIIEEALRRYE